MLPGSSTKWSCLHVYKRVVLSTCCESVLSLKVSWNSLDASNFQVKQCCCIFKNGNNLQCSAYVCIQTDTWYIWPILTHWNKRTTFRNQECSKSLTKIYFNFLLYVLVERNDLYGKFLVVQNNGGWIWIAMFHLLRYGKRTSGWQVKTS